MKQAIFVTGITVQDPDTGADVHLEVFKHQNGAMFAIDSSYLESIGDICDEEEDNVVVADMFDDRIDCISRMVELVDAPEID